HQEKPSLPSPIRDGRHAWLIARVRNENGGDRMSRVAARPPPPDPPPPAPERGGQAVPRGGSGDFSHQRGGGEGATPKQATVAAPHNRASAGAVTAAYHFRCPPGQAFADRRGEAVARRASAVARTSRGTHRTSPFQAQRAVHSPCSGGAGSGAGRGIRTAF